MKRIVRIFCLVLYYGIAKHLPVSANRNFIWCRKIRRSVCKPLFSYCGEDVNIEKVSDLKNYPLILPSATSSIRLKLDEYMESQNTKLMPIIESWTTEFMIEMVRRGVGIGYFVKNVIDTQDDRENFEVITFDNTLPAVDVCCVYIDDFLTSATKKFIEMLTSGVKGE